MRRRSRTRRGAKWAVTSLLLLLIVVGGLSCLWSARYVGSDLHVRVRGGTLLWAASDQVAFTDLPLPTGFRVYWRPMRIAPQWPRLSDPRLGFVPLWIPTVVLAIATAFLWRLDRRRTPPGHCQKCGYNLTGNVSGVCPECGTEIDLASSRFDRRGTPG